MGWTCVELLNNEKDGTFDQIEVYFSTNIEKQWSIYKYAVKFWPKLDPTKLFIAIIYNSALKQRGCMVDLMKMATSVA